MTVEINIPAFLQPLTCGVSNFNVSGQTLGECLDGLVQQFPGLRTRLYTGNGVLHKGINIFINSGRARHGDLTIPIDDGDKIHITYVTVGG